MQLVVYLLLILCFSSLGLSQSVLCINKCDCSNPQFTDIIIVHGLDDCCQATSTPAKGNVNLTDSTVTGCSLCPNICGLGFCEIDPITVSLCLIQSLI